MKKEKSKVVYRDIELLDELSSGNMSTKDFVENEKALEVLSAALDNLIRKKIGYLLISMTINQKTNIILITKTEVNDITRYNIDSWIKSESLQKNMQVVVHEESNEDIEAYLRETPGSIGQDEAKASIIKESLTGYSINKRELEDLIKFIKTNSVDFIPKEDIPQEISEYFNIISKTKSESILNIENTVNSFCNRLECEKLDVNLSMRIDLNNMFIGKIDEVREINNIRYTKVNMFVKRNEVIQKITLVTRKYPMQWGNLNFKLLDNVYTAKVRNMDDSRDFIDKIPYNLIDKGRYILAIRYCNDWGIFVSEDPRNDANANKYMLDHIVKEIDSECRKNLDFSGTVIRDGNKLYNIYKYEDSEERTEPIASLKAIKKMVDEYNYIDKKKKATGQDINISDNIKYNHKEGKVTYNDFSIAINDEIIKKTIYDKFEDYLVKFYRGEITEEKIINEIIDNIFKSIKYRISSYKSESNITITFNDKATINLTQRLSGNKSKLTYLNGIRFNLNEVIVMLKEMTCYRNQEEADNFIKMIGKIGLSTYIAVTTGYEVNSGDKTRLFKFRKEKGRSKYTLLLDTIDLKINSKKLISLLYSNFIENDLRLINNSRLNQCIEANTSSSMDYLKYKYLIDSAYTAFKDRSREFMEKKMLDIGATHVQYLNKKSHKKLEGVLVTGQSGNNYVIAYNNKESFVFMNPTLTKDFYEDGKYICMVDQSNIKSNIGYDTVISKMISLKNDSIIAKQIYNLKDQLDIKDLEGERENDKD